MSDSAAPAKKASKPRKAASHPPFGDMVAKAIKELAEKKGSSKISIKKHILAHYKLEDNKSTNTHLNLALKRGVASGKLITAKGHSGHFKANKEEKAKKPAKKGSPKKTAKKTAAKKASPKKAAKKPAAKKSPAKKAAKKPAAKKTPKKAAKPKAAKKPAAKKASPKKVAKKPAAKKPAAKKPAAKKTPKKAAPKKK